MAVFLSFAVAVIVGSVVLSLLRKAIELVTQATKLSVALMLAIGIGVILMFGAVSRPSDGTPVPSPSPTPSLVRYTPPVTPHPSHT